jgi:hypothetical protein
MGLVGDGVVGTEMDHAPVDGQNREHAVDHGGQILHVFEDVNGEDEVKWARARCPKLLRANLKPTRQRPRGLSRDGFPNYVEEAIASPNRLQSDNVVPPDREIET